MSRPVRSLRIPAPILLALALIIVAVALNRLGMRLFYPDLVSTIAIMVLSLLAVLLVRQLVPPPWRPSGAGPLLVAALAAYLLVRLSVASDWAEFLDHAVLEPLGGEVDDASTAIFAGLGAAGAMVALRLLSRWPGRSAPRGAALPGDPADRPAPRGG